MGNEFLPSPAAQSVFPRCATLFRAQLQPDDADENEQGEEHTQQRGGVAEATDADDERADGTDASPNDVRRAHGDALLRPIKEL